MNWYERQKAKGFQFELKWWHPKSRKTGLWRYRKTGQKPATFKHPCSKSGYAAALAEFYEWKKEQDADKPLAVQYKIYIKLFCACLHWYDQNGVPDGEEEHKEAIENVLAELRANWSHDDLPNYETVLPFPFREPITIKERPHYPADYMAVWKDRTKANEKTKTPQTIEYQVVDYLGFKAAQAIGDVAKPRTFGTIKSTVNHFVNWIGGNAKTSTINSGTFDRYYQHLLKHPSGQKNRENLFGAARQFIRWLWRNERIENLPRNIDSKDFGFVTNDVPTIAETTEPWTTKELETALANVPDDFKLFLLLQINCAFTAVDIAEQKRCGS